MFGERWPPKVSTAKPTVHLVEDLGFFVDLFFFALGLFAAGWDKKWKGNGVLHGRLNFLEICLFESSVFVLCLEEM